MRSRHRLLHAGLGVGLAVLASCVAADPVTPTAVTTAQPQVSSPTGPAGPPSTETPPAPLDLSAVVDFPKAQSVSVVSGPDDVLYLVLGQGHSLFVSGSTDGGQSFSDPVLATGEHPVHVLNIERPAIAASRNGQVGLAWLEIPGDYNGGQIWYAASDDGGQTFRPGQLVATDASGETTMVEAALDEDGHPLLVWLNGSRLQFARSLDQGRTFTTPKVIGDGSCECCQPRAAVIDDKIYITYRSLEPAPEAGDIRDIVLIRSEDNGQTFEPVTRVSDTHWYLSACPIAGPSLAIREGEVVVAWMDGRFAPPGTFSRGDVWLAHSSDGGQSFRPNVRLNLDQRLHHTKPTVAFDPQGRLHVVWEAQGDGQAMLYYASSQAEGQPFTPPQVLATDADGARGRPQMAVLAITPSGQVAVAWIDRQGARLVRIPAAD